jgi:dUTP pyrophosphatase
VPGTGGPLIIQKGDRIAPAVLARAYEAVWSEVEDLSDTERGAGGFGSTGR